MNLDTIGIDLDSALEGKTVFTAFNYWENTRALQISQTPISELCYAQQKVWNLLRQESVLKAMVQRSSESGLLGWVWASDFYFRDCYGLPNKNPIERFTIKWYTQSELCQNRVADDKKAGLELIHKLIGCCDPQFQCPCWISGLPYPSNEKIFYDLVFIADIRLPSDISFEQFLIAQKV